MEAPTTGTAAVHDPRTAWMANQNSIFKQLLIDDKNSKHETKSKNTYRYHKVIKKIMIVPAE